MSDPICGNCGNPTSKHFREFYGAELRVYCNQVTNGDVFTDEPQDSAILDIIMERYPDFYDKVVAQWKRENGHQVESD